MLSLILSLNYHLNDLLLRPAGLLSRLIRPGGLLLCLLRSGGVLLPSGGLLLCPVCSALLDSCSVCSAVEVFCHVCSALLDSCFALVCSSPVCSKSNHFYCHITTEDNVQNAHTYSQDTQCTIRHTCSYQYTLYTKCTHFTLCTPISTMVCNSFFFK